MRFSRQGTNVLERERRNVGMKAKYRIGLAAELMAPINTFIFCKKERENPRVHHEPRAGIRNHLRHGQRWANLQRFIGVRGPHLQLPQENV